MSNFKLMIAIVCLCAVSMVLYAADETAKKESPKPQLPKVRPMNGYVGGPYKVKAVDVTGDKIPDLLLGYYPIDVLTVDKGDGKGNFERTEIFQIPFDDRTIIDPVFNIDVGDVDGDGLIDVAIGVGGTVLHGHKLEDVPTEVLKKCWAGRVVVARNTGGGKFKRMAQFSTGSSTKGVALADLDNDGKLDLLYTARGSGYKGDLKSGKLYIRKGLGDFKFGPAMESDAGQSAYYVETGDLDGDGFLDVLVPNVSGPTVHYFMSPGKKVMAGKQELSKVRRVVTASHMPGQHGAEVNDVRAVDLNGDGKLDLVTANLQTATLSVFIGNGDGTFQKDTLLDGGKYNAFFAIDDLDCDGDNDIVVTHWREDTVAVLLNKGDGSFSPRINYKSGMSNYGVAIFDATGDGKLDIVTANYQGKTGHSIALLKGNGDGTFEPPVVTPKGLRLNNGQWIPLKK